MGYLYEQMPRLRVIAAGSLIEFALKEVSVPVGRIEYLEMYPLTFFEFLDAIGRGSLRRFIDRMNPEAAPSTTTPKF